MMGIWECGVVLLGRMSVVSREFGDGVGVVAILVGEIWGAGGVVRVVVSMFMWGVGVDSVGGVVVYVLQGLLLPSLFPVALMLSFCPAIC